MTFTRLGYRGAVSTVGGTSGAGRLGVARPPPGVHRFVGGEFSLIYISLFISRLLSFVSMNSLIYISLFMGRLLSFVSMHSCTEGSDDCVVDSARLTRTWRNIKYDPSDISIRSRQHVNPPPLPPPPPPLGVRDIDGRAVPSLQSAPAASSPSRTLLSVNTGSTGGGGASAVVAVPRSPGHPHIPGLNESDQMAVRTSD